MLFWGTTCPWGPYTRLAYSIDQEHEAILRGIRQHCRDRIQSGELDDDAAAELEAVLVLTLARPPAGPTSRPAR